MVLGEPVDQVHIHNLSWNSKYLASIQSLEVKHNSPLSYHDIEFKSLQTKWIHESGVHVGIRQARRQIVFMLRITYANLSFIPHSASNTDTYITVHGKICHHSYFGIHRQIFKH
jgi:hypothetical protein